MSGRTQKYFHVVPELPWHREDNQVDKDVEFKGVLRCTECRWPMAYMLEVDGRTALQMYDNAHAAHYVYRSEMHCSRCGAERDFVSVSA